MPHAFKHNSVLMACLLACAGVHAQVAPDAGRTLQQQQAAPALPVQRQLNLAVPPLLDRVAPGGPQAQVSALRFTGNSVFSSAQLQAALGAQALAQPLDLSGLQGLAEALSQFYRAAGYPFARVFVPAQTLQDGTLSLQVVEGRYGQVTAQGEAKVSAAAQDYLAALQPGALVESRALERATLLLADLPGVQSSPLMRPGQELGTGDLVVAVQMKPTLSGDVSLDNHGNRYNGAYRGHANLQYDSPFLVGDQIQLRTLLTDEQMWLGSLSYSLPLGAAGLRASGSYAHTYYQLGQQFSSAQAKGTADVSSAGLSWALLRSQQANVQLSAQAQYKDLTDRQDAAGTRSRKSSTAAPLTASFDVRDALLGGAVSFGSLGYTLGRLTLDDTLRATDATTARTEGRFGKVNLDLARLQSLPAGLNLYLRTSVQWADGKNLDSSEGFGAGGPSGVRAYPVGEAYGDSGWLAQAELRYSLGAWAPYAFYDAGGVTINAKPWNADANRRSIAGAGLGLRYQQGAVSADVALAWRTQGGAPQADTVDRAPRAWATMGYKF